MYVNTALERKRPRIQATFWGNLMLCLHWVAAKIERNLCFRVRFAQCMSSFKARSHGAIFFCECDCNKKWVVWMSMRLFTWCDCNAFVCAMSHMNGFHSHSVWLQCVIPICIYTDCSHTMWTNSLKLQEKIVIKCYRKRNKSHRVNEPLEPCALFYISSSRDVATVALHHNGQYICTQYGKPFSGEMTVICTLFSEMRPLFKVCSHGTIATAIFYRNNWGVYTSS